MENQFLTIAEVAQLLNYKSPQSVRKLIDSGVIKCIGSGKLIRISRESLKEYLESPQQIPAENPPDDTEQAKTEQGRALDGEKAESTTGLSETAQNTLLGYKDATALAKAEVAKINAEIQRDEAVGRRDLPEKLAKRESSLADFEKSLSAREQMIKAEELNLSNRDIVLKSKEQEITKKMADAQSYYQQAAKESSDYLVKTKAETDKRAEQVIAEAQAAAKGLLNEANEQVNAKKFELDNLDIEIQKGQETLKGLEIKAGEARAKLDAIVKEIKEYTHQVNTHAVQHYHQAEHSRGMVSDHHNGQANHGWDLEKELDKLLKWIGM